MADSAKAGAQAGFLSRGFRPFFLGAGLWSVIAMVAWLFVFTGQMPAPGGANANSWHAHEMLFGYGAAVVAGFLLTAIPNWTSRLPVAGAPLAALMLLWFAGRLAMLLPDVSAWFVVLVDGGFLWVFCLLIAREVLSGGNWRNAPVVALVALLALANSLYHAATFELIEAAWGLRLGIAVFTLLIALIGGRVVPSFTRNWLAKQGPGALPAPFDRYDQISLALTAAALLAWVASGENMASGALLVLSGLLLAGRVGRWQPHRTGFEPLVWILSLSYGWLACGVLLLGLAGLFDWPISTALHALTVGAIGGMTLAMMTRAILGHSDRLLTADRTTTAAYLCISLSALVRLFSDWAGELVLLAWLAADLFWILAYMLFLVRYAPILLATEAK